MRYYNCIRCWLWHIVIGIILALFSASGRDPTNAMSLFATEVEGQRPWTKWLCCDQEDKLGVITLAKMDFQHCVAFITMEALLWILRTCPQQDHLLLCSTGISHRHYRATAVSVARQWRCDLGYKTALDQQFENNKFTVDFGVQRRRGLFCKIGFWMMGKDSSYLCWLLDKTFVYVCVILRVLKCVSVLWSSISKGGYVEWLLKSTPKKEESAEINMLGPSPGHTFSKTQSCECRRNSFKPQEVHEQCDVGELEDSVMDLELERAEWPRPWSYLWWWLQ